MIKRDVIIVGHGIAGMSLSVTLSKSNISHIVIDSGEQNASKIAAGVYNPIVLKRFNTIWKADEMNEESQLFFKHFEAFNSVKVDYKLPVLRRFANKEEVTTWCNKCQQAALKPFLNPLPINNPYTNIHAENGFGEVYNTGRIDIAKSLATNHKFLLARQQFRTEIFDYDELKLERDCIVYKDILANHIVFCEGMGVQKNPFFKSVNIIGNKGQTIEVKIPELTLQHIIKASVFLLPLSNQNFKVGATYERFYQDELPTPAGTKHLINEFNKILNLPFELVETLAGIRPTTPNRRPVIGSHPKHKKVWILNGMGTRGVLLAPWAAKQLTQAMFQNTTIHSEVDVLRFFN